MRREGYELQVGQPRVITKEVNGQKYEPIENLVVDVPDEFAGKVIELAAMRKGELTIMEPKGSLQHLEFTIPSRGLIGLRSLMLTATCGEAIMAHRFIEYQPWKGDIPSRRSGVLVSKESGPVVGYALFQLQDRGNFFVAPGMEVYGGQVIGETNKQQEMVVNVQKSKQLTNVRASGSDDAIVLAPPIKMSLEDCLEYIDWDEYVEATPLNIRIRKIWLDENERKRHTRKN
jgi:GTP-binding protein